MSDFINLSNLKSFKALEVLSDERAWTELHHFALPEEVAWLVAKLKHVPDSDATFPFGKWATIQNMQDLADAAAKKEVGG